MTEDATRKDMRRRRLESVDTIEALLFTRRAELIDRLGIRGRREGAYLVAINPARADNRPGSFKINMNTGLWKDWASGDGAKTNPMLALVCTFACKGDFLAALTWSRDFLGLTGREPSALERKEAVAAKKAADDAGEKERETKRHRARKIYHEALPLTGEDPASLYLAGRGIDVMALADGPPGALRFHPACRSSDGEGPFPTLVAHVSLEKLKSGLAGIHRIYLRQHEGRWVKAREGARAKESLGAIAGASVRLVRGSSGKSLAEAPAGEWLAVTEGIEDALTIALKLPHLRVLAAVSLSNVTQMQLPAQLGGVYLVADNDAPGSAAETQLQRAALALTSRNFRVKIVRMPDGYKDPNEVLQAILDRPSPSFNPDPHHA